jgi:hypothetical protein
MNMKGIVIVTIEELVYRRTVSGYNGLVSLFPPSSFMQRRRVTTIPSTYERIVFKKLSFSVSTVIPGHSPSYISFRAVKPVGSIRK